MTGPRTLELDKGAVAVLPETFAAEREIDLKATAVLVIYPVAMSAEDVAKLIEAAKKGGTS